MPADARLESRGCTTQSHTSSVNGSEVPEKDWIDRLLPSERRNLRVAAKAYLGGLLTREEIKGAINATRLLSLAREAADLRGGW